ncbi:MAG: hypothetical protein QXH30_02685, partial [Candidatus Bilamarchaeaceae archaeon]
MAYNEKLGLGSKLEIDPDLLLPDMERSLNEGALVAMEWANGRDQGGYYWQMIEAVCEYYHIDMDAPVSSLSKEQLDKILYGTGSQ